MIKKNRMVQIKMYTKEQLVEKIENKDLGTLDKVINYIKNWRIDCIYEDEKNIEYYDDLAVYKLNYGIQLKVSDKNDEEISSIINNGINPSINSPAIKQAQIQTKQNHPFVDLNKVTVDITAQTLALLAESVAQKITTEITDKIRTGNVSESSPDSAKIKRDHDILSSHVEMLLEENKRLITRNVLLQGENAKFKHLFGNWYTRDQ